MEREKLIRREQIHLKEKSKEENIERHKRKQQYASTLV